MLFGCIHVPDFSVQASLRAEAGADVSFQADAIAVLDGPESLLKVFACNDRARQAGIEIGMTKLQAEACPGVVLRKRITEQEESAQAALLDCAYRFSPRVESTCAGTVIVDLTGAGRLLGSHQEMGEQLAARAAVCGFTVNVGIAANADTALHAARGFTGIAVIAGGEEAQRLACLPVEVLQPSPEILDTLDSWGIRNCKALAALPSIPLTQRLGQQGLHLQRLARGEVRRELVPAENPPSFQESLELEEAVDLLDPLGFMLNRLLEELMARLQTRSLATDKVQVDLVLEVHPDRQLQEVPGSSKLQAADPSNSAAGTEAPLHQRIVKLPVPTQDAKVLLKLLQLDLAAHPPPAPVKKITVEIFAARVRLTQAGLFQPLAPEPAKLEITLARLRAAVGESDEQARARVGFPVVADSHRPDSFEVLPCRAEEGRGKKEGHGDQQEIRECLPTPRLVLRWFRPPLAAQVECSPAAGVPVTRRCCAFGGGGALGWGATPVAVIFHGVKATVVQACGPWRSSGSWWDQARQWQRDEWDVTLSLNGASGLYRIFRDLQSGQWFVDGMYD
jgi:protein ImuB